METSRTNKVNFILLGILFVLALVVGGLFLIKEGKNRKNNEEILSATIRQENERIKDNHLFFDFAQEVRKAKEQREIIKKDDIAGLQEGKYDCVQLSMWNDDVCTNEWYEHFFAQRLMNSEGLIETPKELKEYLEASMSSDNKVEKVFLCLDPDELEKNYYDDTYYDSEPISYEEYISHNIIPFMGAFEEVEFCFLLPNYSVSYLASLSKEELSSKFDNWYKFMMYLHWCSNASVSYLGAEEWLVAKDSNYFTNVNLEEEVEKRIYLYEYAYVEYRVNGPEFLEKRKLLEKYIDDYNNGAYDWDGLQGEKVVFLGDSIFDYAEQRKLCIPSYFECFTGATVYNLSKCGTLATSNGACNFCEISQKIYKKEYINEDGKNFQDYKRFLDECDSEDKLLFVINYGFNDYFKGVKIYDEENPDEVMTYRGALHKSINTLRLAYPNSEFVVLSPYLTNVGEFGTVRFSDYGGALNDYIEAAQVQAEIEDAKFINMNDAFNVTKENIDVLLADGVHPALTESIDFARLIYEEICK